MRRSLPFGLIAAGVITASVLGLLVAAEVRTRYAQDLAEEDVFGPAFPCEEWQSAAEWEELNRELTLAEDYVGGSLYTALLFDEDSARAAGISDETLALNDETLAFINAQIKDANMDDEDALRLLDEEYPKLKAFFDCAEYRRNPY